MPAALVTSFIFSTALCVMIGPGPGKRFLSTRWALPKEYAAMMDGLPSAALVCHHCIISSKIDCGSAHWKIGKPNVLSVTK